ncbi:AAA domain-containing protein [Pseudochryseolinea flava]|uniref:DNA helicase I n=1 Tax=Pseudochryseolinea flava TaxID=2059302 RepID=A0A364Y209_9BACT|nr:AAA domain-containing protein [Pseudochryseolinea flava]RAW00697.1 DNA helicase I [Pseudochryseolinea flava]
MAVQAKIILQAYLRRLTNLSGNNRSLFLLRLPAEQLMDVHELSFLNGDRSFEVINALIAGRDKKLCQVLDARVEANNEASKKLKALQRIDQFIFEERGSNDLHVGWPFVRGKFADGTMVRCPLLFFPVSIVQEGQHWVLRAREDAGITFNKAFLLAYSFYNKVSVDEELLDINFEDFDTDSTVFRTQIYQHIKDKVEINFNPDNFRDELTPFQVFKKDEFDEQHRNGEIKLFPEAVLGIFPQAGSQLVPDYLHLIEQDGFRDLEEFFESKSSAVPGSEGISRLSAIPEEKLFAPFVLDAHQENAIRAVKRGQSIVVQGPPGTGKSQLICNLLADAIASGKRALLVCQKRAALDVVYERLKEIDLGDFLGLIHDFRNDRKDIFGKLARQIESVDDFKTKNRSVDVIQKERRFLQISRTIDQVSEELEEFRKTLFDERECGLPIKELYLTCDPHRPAINIRQEYHYFNFYELDNFIRQLKLYSNYASWLDGRDYPWRDRKSFAALKPSDEKVVEKAVTDIATYQKQLSQVIFRLIGIQLDLTDSESFLTQEEEILGMLTLLKDPEVYQYFQAMSQESDDETSSLWLSNTERVALNCFIDDGPERTVVGDQIGRLQEALHQCMEARRNIFRRIKWEFFSEKKQLLKSVLELNNLPYNKEGFLRLEKRIDCRLNLEHHLTALKRKPWLIDLPTDYDEGRMRSWFNKQRLAVRSKLVFNTLRTIRKSIHVHSLSQVEFMKLMNDLLAAVKQLPEKKQYWGTYLSAFQIRQLIEDPTKEGEYLQALRRDFENLCAYDVLKEELKPFEQEVIVKLHDHIHQWDPVLLEQLFQNSLRLCWIDHIETKYPILRAASTSRLDVLQAELERCVKEKEKISEEILLVKARERAYENLEYNRLNNRVTYRDLLHQVTKKKKIWPVRKVISDFKDEVFQLIPCWMASPESVSAIFPMQQLFDVVIFDEASQCFTERGIPAMYRGKQIVVAGDDKQLRPNELYQIRWDDELEEPDVEVDSLLALTARYVSTVHLQGHYRSHSLELIDFSNRYFYEGRLQLLPDRTMINQNQAAIEYHHVPGFWENHTNQVEAQAVVDCVMSLLQTQPGKSIGVVTFNAPQQILILDLLESEAAKLKLSIPSSLFVKNIENVQGDEKDVIVFSIGYAPDKKGKMVMQFGSLNAVGGENRLNVAITRAREKVVVITSILPEQLKTESLKNDGPELLRKYLAFARDVHHRKFVPAVQINLPVNPTWYLSPHLQSWVKQRLQGYDFDVNVLPYTDISVRQGDQYLGAVLTDDARYFQALSVKDVYAYTPSLLNQKRWRYHTVYSRNFWKDREKVESELMRFVGSGSQ